MQYKTVGALFRRRNSYSDVSAAELESIRVAAGEAIAYNDAAFKQAVSHHGEMVRLARLVYGEGSNEVRYLRDRPPAQPPKISAAYHKFADGVNKAKVARELRLRREQAAQQAREVRSAKARATRAANKARKLEEARLEEERRAD